MLAPPLQSPLKTQKFCLLIQHRSSLQVLKPNCGSTSIVCSGFRGGSDGKESACNAGDLGLIPGLGRSPGGEHGNPVQYSCLENPIDKRVWQATIHGVIKSQTQLSE